MQTSSYKSHDEIAWRRGFATPASRFVAEETAIALSYNGSTHAVMMATPADLRDFGIGFTLTEGIVARAGDVESIDLVQSDLGVEIRMWLDGDRATSLAARRRSMRGPVGCGLCGIESLQQASREPRRVASGAVFQANDLLEAMQALAPLQALNQRTKSVHAAALWRPTFGVGPVREDVGRHNALDKLAGAIASDSLSAHEGVVLLTSRVSVEMVQKTAIIGASVLIAISAPTTLAIRTAEEAGITLVAIARPDGFDVFTHPDRILLYEDTLQRAAVRSVNPPDVR
jgi:FdhD protein